MPSLSLAKGDGAQNKLFAQGIVVAQEESMLFAPQNTFQIGGSTSISSGIKLVKILEEGTFVKKGEVVAWFHFNGKRLLRRVKTAIRTEKANYEKSFHNLKATQDEKALAVNLAEVDFLRKKTEEKKHAFSSTIKQKEVGLEKDLSKSSLSMIKLELASQKQFTEDELNFLAKQIARKEQEELRYYEYLDRFTLKAPHSGYLIYAYNEDLKRAVHPGDQFKNGAHVASVAVSKRVAVDFYVAEDKLHYYKIGDDASICDQTCSKKYQAKITEISGFPQEIGFLKNAPDLPEAREKYYVLRSEFIESDVKLSTGIEIEVAIDAQ